MTAMPATIDNVHADLPVPAARPQSAVSTGVGIAGLLALVGWFAFARSWGMDGPDSAMASMVVCGLAMVLWSVLVDKVHRNASTGIDWSLRRAWAEVNTITPVKIAGLWATWAIIAAIYCIFRFYWGGQYRFSMDVLAKSAIPLVILSVPYLLWLDRRMVEPRDGAWHFGQWLLGGEGYDVDMIWRHWRAWAVKAFFLAFMLSIVVGNFAPLVTRPWDVILSNPVEFAIFGVGIFYLIDVHFATVGYVLTMRPLDAHIRTANPYGMGWVAALACYPPFVMMNPGGILHYEQDGRNWNVWFDYYQLPEAAFWLWGGILLVLTGIYAWATVAFGIRFSNLTHRGIITHGPYRFTRHPAYLAKNSFWWLSSLAILPWEGGMVTALRNTALLAAVSGVYYWRAKTEEKHLLADPAYRAYWEWAQHHALVPRMMQHFTGLARPVVLQPDPRAGPSA